MKKSVVIGIIVGIIILLIGAYYFSLYFLWPSDEIIGEQSGSDGSCIIAASDLELIEGTCKTDSRIKVVVKRGTRENSLKRIEIHDFAYKNKIYESESIPNLGESRVYDFSYTAKGDALRVLELVPVVNKGSGEEICGAVSSISLVAC